MLNYSIYVFFGLAPSAIWLLFFLRKDKHPESNSMVLKIFFYGMLSAVLAVLLELGLAQQLEQWYMPKILSLLLYVFVGIAFVEEAMKYLVIKTHVLKDPEFDEPVDLMLYMIIAALGFAALENLFVLFPLAHPFLFFETFVVSSFRFVGATFLHALCSGLIGYFVALSFCQSKNRFKVRYAGIAIAVLLHGLYDFSIISIGGNSKFIIPIIILITLSVFVSLGFKKVKKLKSVCLPQTIPNRKGVGETLRFPRVGKY